MGAGSIICIVDIARVNTIYNYSAITLTPEEYGIPRNHQLVDNIQIYRQINIYIGNHPELFLVAGQRDDSHHAPDHQNLQEFPHNLPIIFLTLPFNCKISNFITLYRSFSMDDIIVIILTLVLTVVAALNQSKKKKQHESQKSGAEPDFWETILHGEEEAPVPVKKSPARQSSEPVLQQPIASKIKSREPLRKSGLSAGIHPDSGTTEGGRNIDVVVAGKKQTAGIENPDDRENELSILEDFSLRKAIIYSEIIQPKYF